MTRKTIIALAISAIACTAWTSSASAAKPKHKIPAAHAQAQAQAETIPGVNPMTNAPASPAVAHPAPIDHLPGANPM